MFRWYVVNTYSGHENKVKHNLEHRVVSLNQQRAVRQIVVPTETVSEMKDNQKVTVEKRTMPGYVLVNMDLNEDSWSLVKGTPGVTGFVGAEKTRPTALTRREVDNIIHPFVEGVEAAPTKRRMPTHEFEVNDTVQIKTGPFATFSGHVAEINEDQLKVKVLVDIFGRETPVELDFTQVTKL